MIKQHCDKTLGTFIIIYLFVISQCNTRLTYLLADGSIKKEVHIPAFILDNYGSVVLQVRITYLVDLSAPKSQFCLRLDESILNTRNVC